MKKEKTLRICPKGHKYYKSSDCPTCPICEQAKKPTGFLALLSAPARRALENEKLTSLKALSNMSEKAILALHGIGPSTLPILKEALHAAGLSFKEPTTLQSKKNTSLKKK